MIVGNGDIASVLPDRDDRVYFASGVSDSLEVRESEYKRERDLLMAQDISKHLVYFGSLSIFYSQTRYAAHKIEMEDLVKRIFEHYTILRLGNITWGDNPNTLINYLRARIERGEPCEVRDEYRYITDSSELINWINLIPPWNCEVNIPGRRMKVIEVIREFCMPEKGQGSYGKSINYNSLSLL